MAPADGSQAPGNPRHPGKAKQQRHAGKVTVRSQGDVAVITLHLSRPEAWSYNMATGELTPTTAGRQENVSPTSGVGVVVKKNPGSSAARTLPSQGGGANLSSLGEGGYDLSVSFPKTASAAAPNARLRPQTVVVTFHIIVNAEGITRDASIQPTVSYHAINTKGTGAT